MPWKAAVQATTKWILPKSEDGTVGTQCILPIPSRGRPTPYPAQQATRSWLYVSESRSVVPDSLRPHGLCSPWNSLGQNIGVGSLSLLQGIFPTQGSNPGPLHRRHTLYHLSRKGSPRILEWVAYPFSRGSSWPRNQTGVSCISGRFFTNWVMREALTLCKSWIKIVPDRRVKTKRCCGGFGGKRCSQYCNKKGLGKSL